jgi:predicted RNA-binding protein YlxR (DUF448 family)
MLIRFTRNAEGAVLEDPTGRAPGRGAYLHDDPDCRALAVKKRSLERALKTRAEAGRPASESAKGG